MSVASSCYLNKHVKINQHFFGIHLFDIPAILMENIFFFFVAIAMKMFLVS